MGRGKRKQIPLSEVAGDRRLPEGLAASLALSEQERLYALLPEAPRLAPHQVVDDAEVTVGSVDGYPNDNRALIVRYGEPFGVAEVVSDGCDVYRAEETDLRAERVGLVCPLGEAAGVYRDGELVAVGHWRMGAGVVTLLDASGRFAGHASTVDLGADWNDDHEEELLLATAGAYLLLLATSDEPG